MGSNGMLKELREKVSDVHLFGPEIRVAQMRGPALLGPTAAGPLAIGAMAMGAGAIGALAIGRLKIGRASIERLEIEELEVGSLLVGGVPVDPGQPSRRSCRPLRGWRDEAPRLQRPAPRPRRRRSLVERSADFDVVIAAGDFANQHNGLEETIEALAAIETPTILVPGNNETEDALRAACEELGRGDGAARQSPLEIDGTEFFGLGAGDPDDSLGLELRPDRGRGRERASSDCPEGAVLVVHSPPQGHCDRVGAATISAATRSSTRSSRSSRRWRSAATSMRHGASDRRSARPRSPTWGLGGAEFEI